MFGLGIFDTIKLGILAVLVIIVGYLCWNYKHMQTTIANQKSEIESLKTVQDVLVKAKDATDAWIKKQSTIQKRVSHEQSTLEQTVPTASDNDLARLYERYRLHMEDKGSNPPNGRGRSTKHPPARKAGAGTVH